MSFSFKQCTATKSTFHNQTCSSDPKSSTQTIHAGWNRRNDRVHVQVKSQYTTEVVLETKLWVRDQIDLQYTAHTSRESTTYSIPKDLRLKEYAQGKIAGAKSKKMKSQQLKLSSFQRSYHRGFDMLA